jgi:hypothetical protein
VASGKVLAYMAGRLTAEEILELYTAYLTAIAGTTLENTDCLYDDLNQMGADTYADASLVLIPSGYSTGVVYGQRPLDSDSQIAFTRASDATRVINGGLIEKVRTNLLLQSNTFSDSSWTKTRSSIVANSVANPIDGIVNASTLLDTTDNATHLAFQSFTATANPYTFSVYVKANGVNWIQMRVDNGSALQFVYFNLSAGAIGVQNNAVGKITSLGNGWYRCSITATATAASFFAAIQLAEADNDNSYAGTGTNGVYIYASQLEVGDIATDYIATGASAVSVGPVSNVPRIDYTGGGCGKLLLEPQRTNVITFSESFDNAGWTKTNATITANAAVSPDGYTNADRLIPSSAQQGILQQNHNITSGQANTLSVFAKASGLNDNFALNSRDNASASNFAQIAFNLSTGTIATAATASGSYSAASGTITPYGNGWYRLTLTHTSSISTTTRFRYFNETASGDGINGYLVYGAQAELNASYATSYIPTLASSVTRVADQAFLSNSTVLPTAYPFTLFADFDVTTATEGQAITFSNSALSNEYFSIDHNAGFYRALSRPSSTISSVTSTVPATVGFHKICGVFTSTTIKLFVDGALVASGANAQAFNSSINDIFVGQLRSVTDTGFRNSVKKALVLKSELTDAQAIELTTL